MSTDDAAPIRVLHVDDEPEFGGLFVTSLGRADERLAVDTVTSGEAALDRLFDADARYDCVVSDYEMPGMSGQELLEAVRAERPRLPFILFTGEGSEEIASEAISAGVTDYLRKAGDAERYTILANRIVNSVESTRAKAAVRRLEELSEAFPDLIFYIDAEGRHLELLAGSANLLVSDPGTLPGRTVHDVFPEGTADRFLATIRRAVDTGDHQTIEYRLDVGADGRWFEARIVPTASTGAAYDAVLWAARDVTDRKEQERELHRYRRLVDEMHDPACIYDREGRYELVNQVLADEAGSTTAEMRGQPSKLIERIRETADGDPFRSLLEGRHDELRGEYESQILDGKVMEYLLTPRVVDGRCVGAVGVSRNITGRKAHERDLKRYRNLVDAMQDPVCVYDREGRFALVGRRLAHRYDSTPEEMIGRPSRLIERIRASRPDDPYQELIDGERDEILLEAETPMPGIDAIMEYRITPLVIDGEREGAVGVSRDITELKERQAALERTNERLDEFAQTVSHDLRNPLSVALGATALARENDDPEFLETVEDALDRMQALIDELLAFAREGESEMRVGPVDLGETAAESWTSVDGTDVRFVNEADRTIVADEARLRQLLENLLRNAVEHASGDVTVRVGDLDDGFFVADDGQGIPRDERTVVFETGYSTADGGTGFGLSIVDAIVDAHEWEIRITESAAGGTRFEITGVESV